MSSILVVGTRYEPALLGLVQKAAALAKKQELSVRVLCCCPTLTAAEAEQLKVGGAEQILHAVLDPEDLNMEHAAVELLCRQIVSEPTEVVLFLASVFLNTVAPGVAAKLQCGLTADCTQLEWSDDGMFLQTRPTFGGRKLATITSSVSPAMATVRKGVFAPQSVENVCDCAIDTLTIPAITSQWARQAVLEVFGTQELVDAKIILAGGLGIGSKENFMKLQKIAKAVGASVGASRAAVAAGFAPYSCQIGQTGVSVQPELYCAFGISGAVQHLSGIAGAKRIYSVNQDPSAPIHSYSDYSLINDCEMVLDSLCKTLKICDT